MSARSTLSPSALGPAAFYRVLNALVAPRPIAWISTRSVDGVHNLAPHSYFSVASVDPPVLLFTTVGGKDTLANVLDTGAFVVNVCTEDQLEAVNATGTAFAASESEFERAGLHPEPSDVVDVPRVRESPAALECRLVGTRSFGASTVVFGEVVHVAVDPAVLVDGRPDTTLLRPLARLDGDRYSGLGDVVERLRVPLEDVR